MTKTYYPHTTDADTFFGPAGVGFEKNLPLTQGGASSLTLTVPQAGNITGIWSTDATEPYTASWNGTYTLRFDVTAAGSDLLISAAGSNNVFGMAADLSGYSSPPWVDGFFTTDWSSRTGTGVKTASGTLTYGTDPQMPLSARATLFINIGNSNSMKSEDWTIAVGTGSSTDFTAPWVTAAATSLPPIRRINPNIYR